MHKILDIKSEQSGLNPQQEKASNWGDGPVLIIAGAGTGKTRVLVNRVARLVKKGVNPESILLLTFTRRAANNMIDRASIILGDNTKVNKVSGGTFHSFSNKILRGNINKIGLSNNYTILDRVDSADAIAIVKEEIGISKKEKRFPAKKTLEKIINLSINKDLEYEDIVLEEYPHFSNNIEDIEKIAEKYSEHKAKNSLMDYNDLLIYLKKLIDEYPEVCTGYKYIMVDEYQDTNRIQADITFSLGQDNGNVMVVGDDTQSIYSFRGANFKNMFNFKKVFFKDASIIKLEENYRSTQPILNLANVIVDNAIEKYTKALFTKKKTGDKPTLISMADERNQAETVSSKIQELNKDGLALDKISVLFRASYQSIPLEIELNKKNIPYVKHGGFKFFETAHVKDLIAHLKVIENPKDQISWNRILLLLEGIGKVGCLKVRNNIANSSKPYLELKKVLPKNKKLKNLSDILTTISNKKIPPFLKIENLLNYYNPIIMDKFDDFHKRKEDLAQLKYIAQQYKNLSDFLTDMSLEPPTSSSSDVLYANSKDEGLLCLSTVHSAKGLEWDTVFIIDMVEGRFPLSYYLESIESLEEERRLFYVACTRAKKNLFITYPLSVKGSFSAKSNFIEEIQNLTLRKTTCDILL